MSELSDRYDTSQIRLSLAGSGNPWRVINKLSVQIILALNDNLSIKEIATLAGMKESEIQSEIESLLETSLVTRSSDGYHPAFLMVSADETKRVVEHADMVGLKLAEYTLSKWDEIESAYIRLSISDKYTLSEMAFILVGSRILDIPLLGIMAQDGRLMPPSPNRPSPDRPNAQYYFWMIEGPQSSLGSYGENETDLPWSDWVLLNFGQNSIDDGPNDSRNEFENLCTEKIASGEFTYPSELGSLLGIPVMDEKDVEIWSLLGKDLAQGLLKIYFKNEESIRTLYETLRVSKHSKDSFGEFMCWYDHVAYAAAIDEIEKQGRLVIPEERFSAIISYKVDWFGH
ncbi:MAG: hypothetical protein ACW98Y_18855 [Candidatus Thorarchaeota archaeon]